MRVLLTAMAAAVAIPAADAAAQGSTVVMTTQPAGVVVSSNPGNAVITTSVGEVIPDSAYLPADDVSGLLGGSGGAALDMLPVDIVVESGPVDWGYLEVPVDGDAEDTLGQLRQTGLDLDAIHPGLIDQLSSDLSRTVRTVHLGGGTGVVTVFGGVAQVEEEEGRVSDMSALLGATTETVVLEIDR